MLLTYVLGVSLLEPDFPYLEALAPFQPLAMKVCTIFFHSAVLGREKQLCYAKETAR